MINVRTTRLLTHSRRVVPGRGVLNNVKTSASAMITDLLDDSRIHDRKRSRCTHNKKQRTYSLSRGPLKGGIVETGGMGLSNEVVHALSSRAFCRDATDDTVGTAARQTRHISSEVLAPFGDEQLSGGAITTELELLVLP